ncbi:MFS transporter [Ruicaihuangia caeni]|uniref:MFS transporter n=1 Tax=Ruicaihuangia caeni TaxID=3042517 RepID=A0AAW6T2F9_9MICO|nr:MFS transporter [Klugiella sp. YN-L-19]MDI2097509.1 MFS transporter [Klugiella sp. YN-L-19]
MPVVTDVAAVDVARVQRRTLGVLATGQVLSGVGMGSTLSLGALLTEHVSGEAALSGLAATMLTLGAAALAIPLARVAARTGRRIALASGGALAALGAVVIIAAAAWMQFWLLLVGLAVLGAGSAVNLQARFAAADLASPTRRGRDLSLVVWATTIGVAVGPNLLEPGEIVGGAIGLPELTGGFAFAILAQLAAMTLYLSALRPDPLLTALSLESRAPASAAPQDASTAPAAAAAAAAASASVGGETDVSTATGPVLLGAAEPAEEAAERAGAAVARTRRVGPFSILVEKPRALIAIVAVVLSHATMVAVMAMTPLHLTQHGGTLVIVGIVISMHTASMYALSPLFGWLSDRLGRVPVIVLGQLVFVASLVLNWVAGGDHATVGIALALLGLGWSASTVSGSAMLTDALEPGERARVQGLSDTAMNLAGAGGGALAGLIMALLGYGGLNALTLLLVAGVLAALALGIRPLRPVRAA